MRPLLVVAGCLAMMTLCVSCLGSEPDGCEADIETVTLHVSSPEDYFFQATDSMQVVFSTDSVITFAVRGGADVSALSPVLTLSPGATVTPVSGSTLDVSQELSALRDELSDLQATSLTYSEVKKALISVAEAVQSIAF